MWFLIVIKPGLSKIDDARRFESDAVPDGDEPGMLFFESILLPEGCFFLCAENGGFRKWWFIFCHFSGGSGFSGWVRFLLRPFFIGLFFAEGWLFREIVKDP